MGLRRHGALASLGGGGGADAGLVAPAGRCRGSAAVCALRAAGLTWDSWAGSSTGARPLPGGIARIESRLNLSNKSGFVGTLRIRLR